MVYRKMPQVPFEISLSHEKVKDSLNYVRLELSLGESNYRLVLERENLDIRGPGEKQKLVQKVSSGEDNVYELRIRVDEKDVTFALDGQPIHSIRRNSPASQGRIALWGKSRRATTITDFSINEAPGRIEAGGPASTGNSP